MPDDPQQTPPMPEMGFAIKPQDLTASQIFNLGRVLLISDRARRENRYLSRMMEHDPDIIAAMTIRRYAVTGLEWWIEAEDPEDPQKRARAKALELAWQRMRHPHQALDHLAKAFWYGQSGASLNYARYRRPLVVTVPTDEEDPKSTPVEAVAEFGPTGFMPIHGDSFLWTDTGEPCIRTNVMAGSFPADRRILTSEGYAIKLTANERAAMLINRWGLDAPEFEDIRTAARVFAGRGLRDLLWFGWFNKQGVEQGARFYVDRHAHGFFIWFFENGTPAQKSAAEAVLKDLYGGNFAATAPFPPEGQEPFKFFEPTGTGWQIHMEMLKWDRERIVKAILCQELMTGTAPTGLGSGVAEAHKDTFEHVINYDARCLADTLTHDFCGPMARANWPEDDTTYRWVFADAQDRDDDDQRIERAKLLAGMGVELAERELRQIGGFRVPEPDEPTVGGIRAGDDDMGDAFGAAAGGI